MIKWALNRKYGKFDKTDINENLPEAITQNARHILELSLQKIKELKNPILYSDTDSVIILIERQKCYLCKEELSKNEIAHNKDVSFCETEICTKCFDKIFNFVSEMKKE
jgi:DNA polymerase elongation subunit (family B)